MEKILSYMCCGASRYGWQCHCAQVATVLGWTYKTELEGGIRLAYEDFLNTLMRAER